MFRLRPFMHALQCHLCAITSFNMAVGCVFVVLPLPLYVIWGFGESLWAGIPPEILFVLFGLHIISTGTLGLVGQATSRRLMAMLCVPFLLTCFVWFFCLICTIIATARPETVDEFAKEVAANPDLTRWMKNVGTFWGYGGFAIFFNCCMLDCACSNWTTLVRVYRSKYANRPRKKVKVKKSVLITERTIVREAKVAGTRAPVPSAMYSEVVFSHKEITSMGEEVDRFICGDPIMAQQWLMSLPDIEDKDHFIIVQTPHGNFGLEKDGGYIEHPTTYGVEQMRITGRNEDELVKSKKLSSPFPVSIREIKAGRSADVCVRCWCGMDNCGVNFWAEFHQAGRQEVRCPSCAARNWVELDFRYGRGSVRATRTQSAGSDGVPLLGASGSLLEPESDGSDDSDEEGVMFFQKARKLITKSQGDLVVLRESLGRAGNYVDQVPLESAQKLAREMFACTQEALYSDDEIVELAPRFLERLDRVQEEYARSRR